MLTQIQANKFAQEAGTVSDNVLKEHYQIYLLDMLLSSRLGESLVFKGGTALRLVYRSFCFSEDLDFSLNKAVKYSDFQQLTNTIPRLFPEAKIKDSYNKRNTFFARICFDLPYKPIPVGIKIEINKAIKKDGFQPKIIESKYNNLTVTGLAMNLEEIYSDKVRMIKERREPRDMFDLWFICQTLNRQMVIEDKDKYTAKEIADRLNPYIPLKHKKILSLFTK